MSKIIQVILKDDLTGEMGDGVVTYTFAVNGAEYEVDLSAKSLAELEKALERYIEVGRPVKRRRAKPTPPGAKLTNAQVKAVREAKAAGKTAKVVAAEFGITPTYVYSLTSGKNRVAK